MANVRILGDAVVLTSDLKLDDLKLVQKMRPKALSLFEEDESGKLVPYFKVGIGDGEVRNSDVNDYGIIFRKASRDEGLAQVTFKAPVGEGDIKEMVAEAIGTPLAHLITLENLIPDVLDEIHAAHDAVLSSIEVM